uniref:Uncharacterized protein n=1 Tax=Davidia involucrata TaxID=16924 RepID=A0A5B7C1V4_DAVIN
MSKQRAPDHVSTRIDEKLALLSRETSKPYIFRVHSQLRKENENAYEPKVVAIGPYHHGKDNLGEMEKHKLRCLHLLLERTEESSVDRYVMAMRDLEESARKCYAETIRLNKDDFVEMMILDGCFIIELFRQFYFRDLRERNPDDHILQLGQIRFAIRSDLMLFENQLPFFILVRLFNMTKVLSPQDDIINLALKFLGHIMPTPKVLNRISVDNVNHLLGLLHKSWCSSFAAMVSHSNVVNQENKLEFIKSTTELLEAGIKFKPYESTSLLDIKFKNGVMEIPSFMVGDSTEIAFRNLIAYEQYLDKSYPRYVTDYMIFMDHLINSAKDVEKLRQYGIINNWLGDDEAISTMLNKLGNNVVLGSEFTYREVFKNVNKHCRQRQNIWMANLRRNYFNSPWAIISFFAALALLLLTLAQTIFTILSFFKQK